MRWRWVFLVVLALMGVAAGVMWWRWPKQVAQFVSPLAQVQERPLAKYSFERLKQKDYQGGEITVDGDKFFLTYAGKRVSGQINVPAGKGPFPVVVMLRGYVDKEVYETGVGTRKVAKILAENGFLTLAPDFLGYGESDPESNDILEARFEKVVTAMYLVNSICQVPRANCHKLFLWGHSNGGQIALTVLAISGRSIPTVLWAPVSKPFPYSILYYSDDLDDRGKMIRKAVADFERDYNADDFSVTNYYHYIKEPLQIHQGTADEAVPKAWSDQLAEDLKQTLTDVTYHSYTGADHNMNPVWNTVVARDVAFFTDNL
ncbi:MAG: hypothetical protein A2784_04520 [Candidatus Chisholmbacteria bacterium RIFCSPHIGHO2_01_FULL_48_12]|uniref:Serine aminopeptidase S33 domain-containing protein n=1 Tax=Candidatus Chisholmbacteria bacterium RIFCSPHIGHO2_01_FULL_48_12 TaxID=1797589 RepID=A0A1G1VJP6_9BACT|nr:MAG: hypothetical protein A2784_04520 [Candidatus Chisholmbacteria bacterium RIFCSPHIGHO2_01_FULL_48_12]